MGSASAGLEKRKAERVESKRNSIVAPLVLDSGDYYLKPNGDKVKFYRKKDVYALKQNGASSAKTKRASSNPNPIQRYKGQYGERVKQVLSHNLGSLNVIRVNNNTQKFKSSNTAIIEPSMLESLDNSVSRLQPILANAKGQGDILIEPSFLVSLRVQDQASINDLAERYNFEVIRPIKTAGAIFLVKASDSLSTSQMFTLNRAVMNNAKVLWTQPLFKSKPYKTAFTPNDPLFTQQWHLKNTGQSGSRCDADCDANNAWGIGVGTGEGAPTLSGTGVVIAVVDDGVQIDNGVQVVHEDLNIWTNPGETGPDGMGGMKENNGLDDDGNGYIDDVNGYDFVDDTLSPLLNPNADLTECKTLLANEMDPSDTSGQMCRCQDGDGTLGPDGDPSPQADSLCLTFDDEVVAEQDNHGTAVAGIAAAKGNNSLGVIGTAYNSQILPVRLISSFDNVNSTTNPFCVRAVEALTYAARHADVINNSWGLDEGTCDTVFEDLFKNIVDGTLMDGPTNISKRPNLGSPLIFASGNSASGWVKFTVPVSTAGEHAYEWRFLRTDFDSDFDDFTEDDSAWVDDIQFPSGDVEDFDSGATIANADGFTTACGLNECAGDCIDGDNSPCQTWEINTDPNFSRSGQSARISQVGSICNYSYLHTIKEGPAGEISFWVWVSTDLQTGSDNFEFLIDGKEVVSYGDFPRITDNAVGYPANITVERVVMGPRDGVVIAVGASDSGDLSNISTPGLSFEERVSYSQYGPTLDILAPSSNQHLGIYTTDRYGAGNTGFDAGANYTDGFGGTSAAAPIVAGVAAAIIAKNPTFSALAVEEKLKSTADKIGRRGVAAYDTPVPLLGNRSEFYGHGRVNMFKALDGPGVPIPSCVAATPTYSRFTDLFIGNFSPVFQCLALGPLPVSDDICFPIKSENDAVAVVCL